MYAVSDDWSTAAELSRLGCRHLTEVVEEGVAFGAVEPAHLVHVVVVVVPSPETDISC